METATPRLLSIYLNDHLTGATGGSRLARRCAASNADTPLGGFLDRLATEIEADREILVAIMKALDVATNPLKEMSIRLAEIVGRGKLNGRIVSYSPLSRLEELEGLSIGIEGKGALWRSLAEIQADLPALAEWDFAALARRAAKQRTRLEPFRAEAAREALRSN